MKRKLTTLLLGTLLFSSILVFAQPNPMATVCHEDIVKPSMDVKYREAMKKLKAACEQHKIGPSWTTISFDDNSYRHIAPIKSFADLDKNPFADLEAKMGKEALAKLWAEFDECLESHSDFVMTQLPELSYLSPTESDNYRSVTFWHPLPGKDNEAESILKEWKKLYESKKAPSGFLVLKVIFGQQGEYVIVSWGKNATDEATKYQKTVELIGEEGGKLWLKTQAITKDISNKRAELLAQFSYSVAN
jgi:hypothetical protein